MSITLYPARLSSTLLMGYAVRWGRDFYHVVGYQSSAQNLHSEANAVVVPIPACQEVTPGNFLNTARANNVLKDMVLATTPCRRGAPRPTLDALIASDASLYTIAVSNSPSQKEVSGALDVVPADRRPKPNWDIIGFLSEQYPGCRLAFWCFNSRELTESGPVLYYYKPSQPDELLLPALQGHDGLIPEPGARVKTDHIVLIGGPNGARVKYRDRLLGSSLPKYLPKQILRHSSHEVLANGDFRIHLDFEHPVQLVRDNHDFSVALGI